MSFVIYGSYGYTGELIVREAKSKGHSPHLAGRSEEKLREQAERHGLDYTVVDVAEGEKLRSLLAPYPAVIHCAGPFFRTYRQMADACLATRTHYTDITGEPDVFSGLLAMDAQAKTAGVMLMPGTGHDVVPTDCLAVYLKNKLPDAKNLKIVISARGPGRFSRGTATTIVENMGRPSRIRRDGKLEEITLGSVVETFSWDNREVQAIAMPLGEHIPLYFSTQIPNQQMFLAVPKGLLFFKLMGIVPWLFGNKYVKDYLKQKIRDGKPGPTDEEREKSPGAIYGEATNNAGKTVRALLRQPNGYTLTARAAVRVVERILAGEAPAGYQSPGSAYGADLVTELEEVTREDLER